MKLYLTKTDNGTFIPIYEDDREVSNKIKPGEMVLCNITRPRNVKFHRKYFAFLKCVLYHLPENLSDQYQTIEAILFEIKLQMRYFTLHITLGGKEVYIPKSISFAAMDELTFQKFYSDSINIALKHFLPGIDVRVFETEIMEFL